MDKNISKKKKILMITARADFGGGPEHVYQLTKKLNDGYEFFIASPKEAPYWDYYCELVSPNNQFEIPKRKFRLTPIFRLSKLIIKNQINLIHSHGKGAGIYGRLLAFLTLRKSVHTFHGIHIDRYNSVQKKIYLMIERLLSKISSSVISSSNSESEKVLELKIVSKKKLEVIPNGVILPEMKIDKNNFFNNERKILTVTRFDYAKNTGFILDIIERVYNNNKLDDFKFVIVGNGEGKLDLMNEANKKGFKDKIDFAGFIEDVSGYYLDAFCYLSTSRWEGMPLAVLEAMSFGLPVVATDVTGNRDLVNPKINGYLYDLNSAEEAAQFIILISENFDEWKRFSKKSRYLVEKYYTTEIMSNAVSTVYEKLLEGK